MNSFKSLVTREPFNPLDFSVNLSMQQLAMWYQLGAGSTFVYPTNRIFVLS